MLKNCVHTSDGEQGKYPESPVRLVLFIKGRRVPIGSRSRSGKSVKIAEGRWVPVKSREQIPKKIAERAKVAVPPAWTDVQYFDNPEAKLLIKGVDSKGRTQYLYNPAHVTVVAKEKFARINALNRQYDEIVEENETNVRAGKEAAVVMGLILSTGIRPGSEKETKAEEEAFGATTLLGKHVRVRAGVTTLEFTGKKGIALKIPVHDPEIASMLKKRRRERGADTRLFDVTGDSLLRYTKSLGGNAGFQSKDFRTHLGTDIALREKRKIKRPQTMREYRRAVNRIADAVAEQLGNTRKVALSSYINPAIFERWRAHVEGTS